MNILLAGAPGSGKDTQGSMIVRELGYTLWSTGPEIDKKLNSQESTPELDKIRADLLKGLMAPASFAYELYSEFIVKHEKDKVLSVGMPRMLNQAEMFANDLHSGKFSCEAGLWFQVPDSKVLVQRMMTRSTCSACGEVYNDVSNPSSVAGICDQCGSVLTKRSYDQELEKVNKRIEIYNNDTIPVREFLEKNGVPFHYIDTSGEIDEIFKRVRAVISSIEQKQQRVTGRRS